MYASEVSIDANIMSPNVNLKSFFLSFLPECKNGKMLEECRFQVSEIGRSISEQFMIVKRFYFFIL